MKDKLNKLFMIILIISSLTLFSCLEESTSNDTQPPEIDITYPADNSEFVQGDTIKITADATDNEEVDNVEFYIDGSFASLDEEEPYEYEWDSSNKRVTDHTIYAKAYDTNDNKKTSEVITIIIVEGNQPPNTPSNPNPANNATSVSTNTTLSWDCSDPEDDPLTYDVYFGTELDPPLVNSGQSDSTYDPDTLDYETTYHWKIKAHDDHSNSTTDDVWQFTTSEDSTSSDTEPPTVVITYPANNSEFVQGTVINITADATDNEEVDNVEFYIDGSKVSADNTEPYKYEWDTSDILETHTVYAKAYDTNDNSKISEMITVSILTNGDLVPPYSLTTSIIDDEDIELTWSDLSSHEQGYLIDKKINNNNWQQGYGSVEENGEIWTDYNVEIYDTLQYRVYAYSNSDSSGYASTNEIEICPFPDTYVGSETSLDVMTWNIEHFPSQGDETISKVIEIVKFLNLDIIVLQEIESASSFETVVDSIDTWQGYRATSASYDINLALIYNTNTITINNITEIFTQDWWAFPRNPLVIDCYFNDKNYIVINNHLKALSGEENVERRRAACESLKVYIDDNFSEKRVILLGDLNDSLTDPEADNVFWQFIADSTNYQFADMAIAQGSTTYWSYPTWPSHLDHILITDELFNAWQNGTTSTLLLDDYYQNYLYEVSDHRPVLIKLNID